MSDATTVVNVRDFIKEYRHPEFWPEDVVYIGRRVSRHGLPPHPLANSYVIGRDGNRDEVIAKYRANLEMYLQGAEYWGRLIRALKGKRLACWCAPEPCHGDVLADLANSLP